MADGFTAKTRGTRRVGEGLRLSVYVVFIISGKDSIKRKKAKRKIRNPKGPEEIKRKKAKRKIRNPKGPEEIRRKKAKGKTPKSEKASHGLTRMGTDGTPTTPMSPDSESG
jgi:hypothetical protein